MKKSIINHSFYYEILIDTNHSAITIHITLPDCYYLLPLGQLTHPLHLLLLKRKRKRGALVLLPNIYIYLPHP